jgi:parallel beta-helix repeat protein
MKTIKKPFKVFAMMLAIPVLTILLSPLRSYADDTAALQALLNAGPVTLPSGHTYNVTGLTVNFNLNMNGDVINFTPLTGAAMRLQKPNITLSNGTIKGTWVPTGSVTSAYSGIGIFGSNTTITNMVIENIQGYGIVCSGALNGLVITNNHIINTSFIAFYFDAESAVTTGGTFSGNTIDKSAIPIANAHQLAVGIRGSSTNGTVTTGWTIANNVIKMPVPLAGQAVDATAECMELRYITNTTVSGNTLSGGSMGVSIIETSGMKMIGNKFSGSSLQAAELGDAKGMVCQNNVVTSCLGVGYLFDGSVGSNGVTMTNDNISGTKNACIETTKGTQNLTLTGCTLTAGAGSPSMNLQATNAVSLVNTTLKGGMEAILLDTCPGNLTVNGGTISNFTKCVVYISNSSSSCVTNNVTMTNVTVSGVPAALGTYLSNGGTIGKAITLHN